MCKEVIEYHTLMTEQAINKCIAKGVLVKDESGYEKLCKKCDELWGFTSEFFYIQRGKGYPMFSHNWCIACYRETRRARDAKRKAAQ